MRQTTPPSLEQAARDAFAATFGHAAAVVASAPGRVNLLGEHTDYNEGFVLPTALPLRTCVALTRRTDDEVRVRSEALDEVAQIMLGAEAKQGSWADYVQGVTRAAREHGHRVHGFEACIGTELPLGSGLASSAALCVALLRALREAFRWSIDDIALAKLAQWGENHLVGAPVGILDPLACQLGDEASALFIDTRSLAYERLPLPADVELVVVDSGVRHAHGSGDYATRRQECERAAQTLGLRSLRELGEPGEPGELGELISARIASLPAPLDRRVRHVVTENARVLRAVEALRERDALTLGSLFNASHVSMRDDFEVSVPEVDRIVEAAVALPNVLGARLTGGGFGGAVIALVEKGHARRVARELAPLAAGVLLPQST
jgi:galactokinase